MSRRYIPVPETEDEARAAVVANGYKIEVETERRVRVGWGKGVLYATVSGVNFRDLCDFFRLHEGPVPRRRF